MRISDIRHEPLPGGLSEVSATVSVKKPRPESYHIWFRGPAGCFGDAPLGDIFFTAYWIPAMFLEEEFEIDGEVSKELVDAAWERLEPIFLRWFRHDLRPALLQGATIVDTPPPSAPGTGLMFSGGLDSTYTLFRNFDSITHLIYVHGFDVSWERDDLAEAAINDLRSTAESLGKQFAVLHTNVTTPLISVMMRSPELGKPRPQMIVDMYFGTGIVAFGLCLRGWLGRMFIASSWPYERLGCRGSHPLIEPSWSTSTMGFSLDGCEANRVDKAAWLLQHRPDAFRGLRVCVKPGQSEVANCGRCSKCLRTMMEMRVAGAGEEHYTAFGRPFDPRRTLQLDYKIGYGFIDDIYNRAREVGDEEIVRITEVLLGKRWYWPRFRIRMKRRIANWTAGMRRRLRPSRRKKSRRRRVNPDLGTPT